MKTFREFSRGKNIGRVLFNKIVEKHVKPEGITIDMGTTKKMSYYRFMDTGKGRIFTADFQRTENVSVVLDLEDNLPFRNNSVDNVIMFSILEHIYDPQRLLEEVRRVLKKEGRIYVSIPFMMYYHPSPRDYSRYTRERLERMLDNFSIETFETIGGFFTVFDYNFTTYFLDAVKMKKLKNMLSYISFLLSQAFDRKMMKIRKDYREKFPLHYFIAARKKS